MKYVVTEKCCLWIFGKVVNDILLGCSETGMWRRELLNEKWPNVKVEVADKEILVYINKVQLMDVGSYLDKVRYKRSIKQNSFKQ
jgi:hypothetical protein